MVSLDMVHTTAEELQDLQTTMTTEETIEMIEKDQTGIITIDVIQVQMEVVLPISIIPMVIAILGAMRMPKERVERKNNRISCKCPLSIQF